MAKISNELIYEVLKTLQGDVRELKQQNREIKDSIIGVRDDVHGLRGDVLRQERGIASLEADVDRIKSRLDITDHTPLT